MKTFASDNYAGVLPEIMETLQQVNKDHAAAYGYDTYTKQAAQLFNEIFKKEVQVRFVFNGTGANVLSLSLLTQPYSAIVCADIAHIYTNESTAPETFTSCRLITVPANEEGKMSVENIEKVISQKGDEHCPQIKAFSLSQATEYGTLYSIEELKAIGHLLKAHNIYFHMDGSRLLNAAQSLACNLHEITTEVGVDVLSLGGTKSGLLFGEAVVVFNPSLTEHLAYQHKRSMQLSSKTRFIAAQFSTLLQQELWKKYSAHANNMAWLFYQGVKNIPGITITKPVQSNVVFAQLPAHWIKPLQEKIPFYIWNEQTSEVRWMCAFDTQEQDVQEFIIAIKQLS